MLKRHRWSDPHYIDTPEKSKRKVEQYCLDCKLVRRHTEGSSRYSYRYGDTGPWSVAVYLVRPECGELVKGGSDADK